MSECKFRAADGECLRERAFPYKEYCVDGPCTHYTSITNADRIRAMTDEELAEFLAERATAPSCSGKCHKDYEIYGELRTFCRDCWRNWLKEEATDDP